MQQEVLITITATAGVGKSTLAEVIRRTLEDAGLSVAVVDDNQMSETPPVFTGSMCKQLESIVSRGTHVTIQTAMARRERFID